MKPPKRSKRNAALLAASLTAGVPALAACRPLEQCTDVITSRGVNPAVANGAHPDDVPVCISQIQDQLIRLGYLPHELRSVVWDPPTQEAVRNFQAYHSDTAGNRLVEDGIPGPRTIPALMAAQPDPTPPIPNCTNLPQVICITKSDHKLRLFRYGYLVLTMTVRFGDLRAWTEHNPEWLTPEGTFRLERKIKDEVSLKFDNAPMPDAMYFAPGVAIHVSPPFQSGAETGDTSHGCVRSRDAALMDWLFANIPMGTRVVVVR